MDSFDKSLTFLSDNENQILVLILSSNLKVKNLINLEYNKEEEYLDFYFKLNDQKFKKKYELKNDIKYDFEWNDKMYIIDHDIMNKISKVNDKFKDLNNLNDEDIIKLFKNADLTKYKIKIFEK